MALGEDTGDLTTQVFGQGVEIVAGMQRDVVDQLMIIPVVGVVIQPGVKWSGVDEPLDAAGMVSSSPIKERASSNDDAF